MDSNSMNQIIEKYWNGESTLEQEQTLISYFNSNNIAVEHEKYAPMFQLIHQHKSNVISDKFDKKLQSAIHERTKVVSFTKPYYFRIAAAIALLISTALLYQVFTSSNEQKIDLYADTFKSPDDAFEAMLLVFGSFDDKMSESTAMMESEIKKLDNLNNFLY
jgi:hypothetical protein